MFDGIALHSVRRHAAGMTWKEQKRFVVGVLCHLRTHSFQPTPHSCSGLIAGKGLQARSTSYVRDVPEEDFAPTSGYARSNPSNSTSSRCAFRGIENWAPCQTFPGSSVLTSAGAL
jgi:hypothetical protein